VGCWYAGSPPLTLSIEHPLGTILASKTLPAVALPLNSEGWVSFEYLNTTLQPGQTYYIVLSFDPGAEYSWSGNWSNPYPPGVSSRDPDWDYCFKTFVTKSKALSQPISEESQNYPDINIILVRLCEDGGIEQVTTKWPLQQYTMYRNRMRGAETNEEVLVVLKEFNIVPKEITLIELKKNPCMKTL